MCIDEGKTNWLNLHGLNETPIIEAIGAFEIDNFYFRILNNDKKNQTRRISE
jgi:magnesium transporter